MDQSLIAPGLPLRNASCHPFQRRQNILPPVADGFSDLDVRDETFHPPIEELPWFDPEEFGGLAVGHETVFTGRIRNLLVHAKTRCVNPFGSRKAPIPHVTRSDNLLAETHWSLRNDEIQ